MQSNCLFAILVFTCIFPSSYCDGLLRTKRNADENNEPEKQLAREDIENKRSTAKQLCMPKQEFVWCIPQDYDQWKEPWRDNTNVSFPWVYRFTFIIVEIQRVDDRRQTVSIRAHFQVAWQDPRIEINVNAAEWKDNRFGSPNEVNISPDVLDSLWIPDLEIYGMTQFERKKILKSMSSIQINIDKYVEYEGTVDITISCVMDFYRYPLDSHSCPFRTGSYYSTEETVVCQSEFEYFSEQQRSLQYSINIDSLPNETRSHTFMNSAIFGNKTYSVCGFNILLKRNRVQMFFQFYFICILFVMASWTSFIINPSVIPGRIAVLITTFLCLINIFNGVKEHAPVSASLNAMDIYVLICIGQVFLALAEYAVVILVEGNKRISDTPLVSSTTTQVSGIQDQRSKTSNDNGLEHSLTRNNFDTISLFLFPLFFILFNIVYWLIFL